MSARCQRYAIAWCEEMGFTAYQEGAGIIVEMPHSAGVDKVTVMTLEELGDVIGSEGM